MKSRNMFPFHGFYTGAVAAAVVLAYGLRLLAVGATAPLTTTLVWTINRMIRHGRFQIMGLAYPSPSWLLGICQLVAGTVVLLVGLRVAAWATKEVRGQVSATESPRRSEG